MTNLYELLTRTLVIALIGLAIPLGARAQPLEPPLGAGPPGMGGPGMGRPAFMKNVFPPGMIMRHQSEIGLTDAQRETITKHMEDAQKSLVSLQWDIERESEKLGKLLASNQVDEAAALRQADQVMNAEQRLKKTHLTLLVRVKNSLTAAQQDQLRQIGSEQRGGRRRGQ